MIKNRADLVRVHGRHSSLVLSALEAAVKSVDPGALVRKSLSLRGGTLVARDIKGKNVKIKGFNDAYVVGAGKASAAMAAAVARILKGRVAGGAINVPRGTDADVDRISITRASHPVPDSKGVCGTKKIIEVLEKAKQDDLVVVVISGGGSALMPMPARGLALKDKQEATSALLASGASINEINAVRKHLSAVKGGQLVQHTRSRVLSLVLSDVVGDDLTVIASGPTFPDATTFSDARQVLEKYGLTGTRAARYIARGMQGAIKETPKPGDSIFARVSNVLIGNNELACKSATDFLRRRKVRTEYLGSAFDGEARDFGAFMARLAGDIKSKSPFALVAGGETTVRLGKKPGKGGRNQEAALACALAGVEGVAGFIGTDGIDGNSDAAGALVSCKSAELARKINAKRLLARHDSYRALEKMGSLIFTGYTGTNVNDIAIVYNPCQ
ncbi:DUF4147 domain-containing protein [Nitrososphaera sp.]|uniref:glycerate kinase type-2 family protein n=1 Tax=Nitrososphaera sp. TaxID=1971748 RepID=UPI001813B713|nr:DUF4147 domain-containing protein [Nitrososphaera sp.]NWG36958.1 DUF4147 domain-containing protein [Nitrososphaera sp.]